MTEIKNDEPVVEIKKSTLLRLKARVIAFLKNPATLVAASAAAGGVASYVGTQKAQRDHAVDVYFKVNDELDDIAKNGVVEEPPTE